MKKIFILFIPVLTLSFGTAYKHHDPQRAWYSYMGPYQLDNKISNQKKGELYFDVHPELQPPKTEKGDLYGSFVTTKDYFTAYLVNLTDTTIHIRHQDGSLIMIQEALDTDNNWKPIEYWQYSTCGNSYMGSPELAVNQYFIVPIKKHIGSFKTKVRLKLKLNSDGKKILIYSDPFEASIDPQLLKELNSDSQDNWYSFDRYLNE